MKGMMTTMRDLLVVLVLASALGLLACGTEGPGVVRSSPEAGSVVAGPLTSVRVWFSNGVDPLSATLQLEGPRGEIGLSGIHTMGQGDLMASVTDDTPAGEYVLAWTTSAAGGSEISGQIAFRVAATPSESPVR